MALDPSTLLSRTAAGDAELTTPTNGLSLGQRKVLTYLEAPQALEELVAQRALDAAKLDRDLGKLAALGLIAINGLRSALASEAIVIGPARGTSMPRWLVALLLVAGGAIAWLGFAGTASHKPAITPIGVAAAPRLVAEPEAVRATAAGMSSGGTGAAVADVRTLATDAAAGRSASMALDARRGGDIRATTSDLHATTSEPHATTGALGATTRQPVPLASAETVHSNASTRADSFAPPAADIAANASVTGARAAATGAPPTLVAAIPATQSAAPPIAHAAGTDATAQGHAAALPANNAAAAGSAATLPAAPANGSAATAPVAAALAMAAPSTADALPRPQAKLVPLTRENPAFPREALSRGIAAGMVKARVSVDALGKVSAVSIVEARPSRVFDRAVVEALSHWTFAAGEGSRSTEVEIEFKRD